MIIRLLSTRGGGLCSGTVHQYSYGYFTVPQYIQIQCIRRRALPVRVSYCYLVVVQSSYLAAIIRRSNEDTCHSGCRHHTANTRSHSHDADAIVSCWSSLLCPQQWVGAATRSAEAVGGRSQVKI